MTAALRLQLENEFKQIQNKTIGDGQQYKLRSQQLVLVQRPKSCFARCLESILRCLFRKMSKLERKFIGLSAALEQYLLTETDQAELGKFLNAHTMAINALIDSSLRMQRAKRIAWGWQAQAFPKTNLLAVVGSKSLTNLSKVICHNLSNEEFVFDFQPRTLEPWTNDLSRVVHPNKQHESVATMTAGTAHAERTVSVMKQQDIDAESFHHGPMDFNLEIKADGTFDIKRVYLQTAQDHPRLRVNNFYSKSCKLSIGKGTTYAIKAGQQKSYLIKPSSQYHTTLDVGFKIDGKTAITCKEGCFHKRMKDRVIRLDQNGKIHTDLRPVSGICSQLKIENKFSIPMDVLFGAKGKEVLLSIPPNQDKSVFVKPDDFVDTICARWGKQSKKFTLGCKTGQYTCLVDAQEKLQVLPLAYVENRVSHPVQNLLRFELVTLTYKSAQDISIQTHKDLLSTLQWKRFAELNNQSDKTIEVRIQIEHNLIKIPLAVYKLKPGEAIEVGPDLQATLLSQFDLCPKLALHLETRETSF